MFGRYLLRQYRQVEAISRWNRLHFSTFGHILLILMLMAGVFGVDTKSAATYQLFSLLAILFLLSVLLSRINRLKVSVHRELPDYATAGEPLSYTVVIQNLTSRSYDQLSYIERLAEPVIDYADLRRYYQNPVTGRCPKFISFRQWRRYRFWQRNGYVNPQALPLLTQQVRIPIRLTPLRRGVLRLSGACIAKPDPLGLFRRLIPVADEQRIWVLPPRYPVQVPELVGRRKYQPGGINLANSVGESTEFMGLRDYRCGDPLHKMHWKSLAKHGRLVVKDYQEEYFDRRGLVLDTDADHLPPKIFEAAVSVAASLIFGSTTNDALLDLMFVGTESYCFTAGRGMDSLTHLQEILAAVQPSDSNSFERLRHSVENHLAECSSLLCVFLHWDHPRQQFVQNLIQQGIPVAVFWVGSFVTHPPDDIGQAEFFFRIDADQVAEGLAAI